MAPSGRSELQREYIYSSLLDYISNPSISNDSIGLVITGLLTNLLSNAATVAVLGPIILDMGGNAILMGIMTSIASAFAYLTVVASPTCMIIHSTGLISSSDYFRAGWKLFVISVLLLLLFSTFYWPLLL